MRFSSERLVLRPVAFKDLPLYLALAAAPGISLFAGFPEPKAPADTRRRVRGMVRDWGKAGARREFCLVRKADGVTVGAINLRWPHKGVGELGYAVLPEFWGNGYAPEAVRRVIKLAFERFGAHRVQATTWIKNDRSVRVLKKAGLRKEGVLRSYLKRDGVVRDEYIFGITRTDYLKKGA